MGAEAPADSQPTTINLLFSWLKLEDLHPKAKQQAKGISSGVHCPKSTTNVVNSPFQYYRGLNVPDQHMATTLNDWTGTPSCNEHLIYRIRPKKHNLHPPSNVLAPEDPTDKRGPTGLQYPHPRVAQPASSAYTATNNELMSRRDQSAR